MMETDPQFGLLQVMTMKFFEIRKWHDGLDAMSPPD